MPGLAENQTRFPDCGSPNLAPFNPGQSKKQHAVDYSYTRLRIDIFNMIQDDALPEHEVIQRMLELVGKTFNISRAAFFRLDSRKRSAVCERQWCNTGITSSLGVSIPYETCKEYLNGRPRELRTIPHSGVNNDASPMFLKHHGVKSCLVAPYLGKGFFTYSECLSEKIWSDNEKRLISEITDIIENKADRLNNDGCPLSPKDLYNLMLDNTQDIFWALDIESFSVQFISNSVEHLTGFTPDEFTGKSLKKFLTPESFRLMMKTLNEQLQIDGRSEPKRKVIIEIEHYVKSGGTIWVETTLSFLRNDRAKPVGVGGISRDITQRKHTENALIKSRAELERRVEERTIELMRANKELLQEIEDRKRTQSAIGESEERFRAILGSAPDAITVKRCCDEKYIKVNDAFCHLTGFSPEDITEKSPADLGMIVNFESWENYRRTLKHLGEIKDYEMQYRLKDGRIIDALISGRMLRLNDEDCVVEILTDNTERKKTNEALRISEERYRLLFENAKDAIFIIQDGNVKFPNPTAKSIGASLNLDLDQVPFLNYVHPEDREMVIDWYRDQSFGEELSGTKSFRLINNDGEQLWVNINTVIIDWEGREAALNFLRDITPQKKLESQLYQNERLRAIGTLAGGIAHDFNNLLMAVQGNVSFMLLDIDESRPHYAQLKSIERCIRSGASLTKQLLGFARGGKYSVKSTNLNFIIDKVTDMFVRTKKELRVHKDFQEDIWTVEVDQGQVSQVLLNLFVNAWQAMPDGGDLHLSTENINLGKNYVKPYGVEPGRYVVITVRDNGIGMSEKTQERIFDPFFTSKEIGKGTGLGLASSFGIIKNHKGFITVSSKKGQGSTFKIFLPTSTKKVLEEEEISGDIVPGTETILLVDDEDMIIDIGQQMLERLGYTVHVAGGGKHAVTVFEEHKDRIDLVILDLIMPDMGGGETFDRLRELAPDIKVLLSSGYSIRNQAKAILDRGGNGFIQKPFELKQLSQKIRSIIEQNSSGSN